MAQNVSGGKVTKVFSSQSSPQPLERVSFPSFPVQFLLVFLKVRRPPSEEMKAYPEQPSGSVMLLLATKKFSTPNVETLKAFSRENEKNPDSHQTLVFSKEFLILSKDLSCEL